MSKVSLHSVCRAIVVASGVLLCAGQAQAGAVYRGNIDPLYYVGDFTIDVPTECIEDNGWIESGPLLGSCGTVEFLGGSLTDNVFNTSDTITFPADPFVDLTIGLYWQGGNLAGIDAAFGPGNSPAGGTFPHAGIGYFLLFTSGHFAGDGGVNPTVDLYCINSLFDPNFSQFHTKTVSSSTLPCSTNLGGDRPTITFALAAPDTPVPEPGTLLLLAGALVAAGLGTRRTRA